MKIAVIGGGGREHALIKGLKKNPDVETIYCLPGNGGIARDAVCVPVKAVDIAGAVDFCVREGVDYAVVAPDDPLVMGMADALAEKGIPCFGPSAKAAAIEGSKVFSKNLMKKYGIPTARYEVFSDAGSAAAYVENCPLPVVVKADGLALGKGVLICFTREEALRAVDEIMRDKAFGDSGNSVVVEEYLEGPEVSVLAFTDGDSMKPMLSSMDHKRAHDGDEGLNTGGMGVVAPNPYYTDAIARTCMETIFLPTMRAMNAEGRMFKGCLYFGLMLTKDGPKVIEYNCRFGDPEAQAVLSLMESDLLTVMRAVTDGTLRETPVRFKDGASCCVMIVSGGYPEKYEKGFPVDMGSADEMRNVTVYHSGTALKDGRLVTAGGRVLGVTATADTLREAVARAYDAAAHVSFAHAYFRHDIGARALKAYEE